MQVDQTFERAVSLGGFLLLMTAGIGLILKDAVSLSGLDNLLQ